MIMISDASSARLGQARFRMDLDNQNHMCHAKARVAPAKCLHIIHHIQSHHLTNTSTFQHKPQSFLNLVIMSILVLDLVDRLIALQLNLG